MRKYAQFCSGEDIGGPLTDIIDTFVGVAGANFGSTLCFLPIPVGTCNVRTGLSCQSRYLANINSRPHYEGELKMEENDRLKR